MESDAIVSTAPTIVLEAPVQTDMINVTLPAILRSLRHHQRPLVVATSTACAAALRAELVPPGTRVLAYDHFSVNPRVELDVIRMGSGVQGLQLVALREQDLMRAARIRRSLGLPGMSPERVALFRDKLLMKRCASEHGIDVPRFVGVDTGADLAQAMQTFRYPWIVKPRRKAAGMGFRVLRADRDVELLLDELAPQLDWDEPLDLIAEEFVGTQMFHVDGVWSRGRFERLLAAEYIGLKPHHQIDPGQIADVLSGSLEVPPDDPGHAPLRAFVERLLQVLGGDASFAFHAEVWQRDGRLLLNEVACRTGGGQVYFLQQEVFGANPDEIHLCALQGTLAPAEPGRARRVHMVARVAPRRGHWGGRTAPLPPGTRLEMFRSGAARLEPARHWHDAIGFVYAEGGSRNEVLRKTQQVMGAFAEAVAPAAPH